MAPGTFGMLLFLVSLGVLFAASLTGVVIVRYKAFGWQADEFTGFPPGLWIGTLLLVGASVALHLALRAIRAGRATALRRLLLVALGLGVGFLVAQSLNWFVLLGRGVSGAKDLFGFSFYLLTGLHALHVVAGIAQLAVVTVKALRGRYTPQHHEGVWYAVLYWHFLDGVWLVLLAALLVIL
jgi:cytochrome c oxidase subunit 3